MSAVVQQLKQETLKHEGCVKLLEDLLERARAGSVIALYIISEEREKAYSYDKAGFTQHCLLGLLQRASFKLNQMWDEANEL